MSYTEYRDLYKAAQKKDCPFIAYFVDVVDSKKNLQGSDYVKHYSFINRLTKKLQDKMKVDIEYNHLHFIGALKDIYDNNLTNPMIRGDGTCYFFEKDKITDQEFMTTLMTTIKECNYPFDLHVKYCKYETDKYEEGNTKLYKGYVFNFLEEMKHDGFLITKQIPA